MVMYKLSFDDFVVVGRCENQDGSRWEEKEDIFNS